jgi:hypothetical protein
MHHAFSKMCVQLLTTQIPSIPQYKFHVSKKMYCTYWELCLAGHGRVPYALPHLYYSIVLNDICTPLLQEQPGHEPEDESGGGQLACVGQRNWKWNIKSQN